MMMMMMMITLLYCYDGDDVLSSFVWEDGKYGAAAVVPCEMHCGQIVLYVS